MWAALAGLLALCSLSVAQEVGLKNHLKICEFFLTHPCQCMPSGHLSKCHSGTHSNYFDQIVKLFGRDQIGLMSARALGVLWWRSTTTPHAL